MESTTDAAIEGTASLPTSLEPQHVVVFRNVGIPGGFAAAVAKAGGEVALAVPGLGYATVSGLSDDEAASLGRMSSVAHVHRDMILESPEPFGSAEEPAADAESPSAPSEAYFFPRQWNLRAIGADRAWEAGEFGSEDVTVAILDTGLDYLYPDLEGRVDLERSISYLSLDDAWVAGVFPGRRPIADLQGHGTHVGSTVVSNGYVSAGVTSQVTLIGVKVCSLFGGCPGSAIFAGVDHAVSSGADVINMSLGGTFDKSRYPGYVSIIERAFNAARAAGVTVVVSAGNDDRDLDHDGSGFKTYCNASAVVCVSATGPSYGGTVGPWDADRKASYSNYGVSAIDVAAPGGDRGGYVWAACSKTRLSYKRSTGKVYYTVCSAYPNRNYALGMAGTSMAAPHTTALAALMVEKHQRNSGIVATAIQNSADDLGDPGADPIYGKGRINVAKALGLD